MALPADRPYPMNVVTLATARVQDLIGLICWQYTVEGRQPPLKCLFDYLIIITPLLLFSDILRCVLFVNEQF